MRWEEPAEGPERVALGVHEGQGRRARVFGLAGREALEIAPNFPMAHHGLGRTYMAMGNYEEAVKTLETAVENAPNEIPIQLDLGRAYKLMHENNKAFEIFTRAAQIAKDSKIKKEAEDEVKKVWDR